MLVKQSLTLRNIAEVIEKEILPDLQSSYPKAQSHAIVSMLRSLSRWENDRQELLSSENNELERLLEKIRNYLRLKKSKKTKRFLKRLDAGLRSNVKEKSLEICNSMQRELLDEFLLLAGLKSPISDVHLKRVRDEVRHFLRQRIELELSLTTASKMAEFSKGSSINKTS